MLNHSVKLSLKVSESFKSGSSFTQLDEPGGEKGKTSQQRVEKKERTEGRTFVSDKQLDTSSRSPTFEVSRS